MPDELALTMQQNIGKQGPALSATSDMPVVTPAAEPAPAAPAAEPTPAAGATEGKPAEEGKAAEHQEGHEEGAAGQDNTPPWMKAEITKERNRRRAAEQRASALQTQFEQAMRTLEQVTSKTQAPQHAPSDDTDLKPQRDRFEDPDAYEEALIDWSSRRAAKVMLAETEARRIAETQRTQAETITKTFRERRDTFAKETPDFEAVAENPDLQISVPMAQMIMTAQNGPQLAYHLGKNPDVAAKLATMPPAMAVFEMGVLAASLQTKKPEVSSAPPPPKPLGSRADATPKTPAEESMDEYAARRSKEIRARA